MYSLSDNYYLRKCFLEKEQVPTQTVMINTMTKPLAAVYFKSMTPKLKVLAGLEPPMKGGGSEWYQPPNEILKGRAVLKPVKGQHLKMLSYDGIGCLGEKFVNDHHKLMEEEKKRVLLESDINWKRTIEASCRQQWEDSSKEAAKHNTDLIKHAFLEFSTMYTTSITKIQQILYDSAMKEVETMRKMAFDKMQKHYETLVKQQASMLYDRYTEKLMKEKARLKAEFIFNVEESRTEMGNKIHDMNVDKHVAIEKLRHQQESQNLACQVYVALKEREECKKEIELSQYEHKKIVRTLKEQIALKDFEVELEREKERKRLEFTRIWQKKVCQVVKKFQMFVLYCLNTLPEHADFFIDMEKLMLLQLNEVIEEPSAESIFVVEEEKFHTPIPQPHPFYLFCDKGYKPKVEQNLCPKHCTSSASQLPVIVINKRFIYAACDNFEKFTDKVTQFVHGRRGDDVDFEDKHEYQLDVPVKLTCSKELLELKLESSLLQVLQKEFSNMRDLPILCTKCNCRSAYCFCDNVRRPFTPRKPSEEKHEPSLMSISSGNKINTRSAELEHEREPKWESYMKFVESKKCRCAKMAKKHLNEHLPPYMRNMSIYDPPDLPNYEMCDVDTLRKLVKKAQGKHPHTPPSEKVPSKYREVSTQYSDQEVDFLCTCFAETEADKLFRELLEENKECTEKAHFKVLGDDMSSSHLTRRASSFATDCAYTLKNVLNREPQLEEIFKKKDCSSEREYDKSD